jgi:hypothetical protein
MATAFIPKITYGASFASSFTFTNPPIDDPLEEHTIAKQSKFIANSGKPSVQRKCVIKKYTIKHQWLTSTEKSSLETFFDGWASYGKAFRYYPDKDVASYWTVYLDPESEVDWFWDRQLADGSGDFIYGLVMKLYRVYA